jgi:hypothetical protein
MFFMQFFWLYVCLQSVIIPADSLDTDIKSLYLSIIAASEHEVNHSDEVTAYSLFCLLFFHRIRYMLLHAVKSP